MADVVTLQMPVWVARELAEMMRDRARGADQLAGRLRSGSVGSRTARKDADALHAFVADIERQIDAVVDARARAAQSPARRKASSAIRAGESSDG